MFVITGGNSRLIRDSYSSFLNFYQSLILQFNPPAAQPTNAPGTSSATTVPGRTDSLKRNQHSAYAHQQGQGPELVSSAIQIAAQHASPKVIAGAFKHVSGVSKGSNIPTPKGSPMRRPTAGPAVANVGGPSANRESPSRQISEEKWIDGPRVSKSKVHEARHLMREINHVKKCETWVDGPRTHSAQAHPIAPDRERVQPVLLWAPEAPLAGRESLPVGTSRASHPILREIMIMKWEKNNRKERICLINCCSDK